MGLFESYLTYETYQKLGGKLPLDVFSIYERKAQRYLDTYTFDRIPLIVKCGKPIPDIVDDVLVAYIDMLHTFDIQGGQGTADENLGQIAQYSNKVETITYKSKYTSTEELEKDLRGLAIDWLPTYLTNRMVCFDVEKYLQ